MGSSVSFYTAKSDNLALTGFSRSLGLHLVPPRVGQTVNEDDPADGPYCRLSLVPLNQLRPFDVPPVHLGSPADPTLEFLRSYYKPPYLISGRIYWSNDVAEIARITKPAYSSLARWIRKHWSKRPDSAFYFGPAAIKLVDEEGAIHTTFPPDLTVQTIIVRPEE
jgi:hypothetical protein